MNYYEHHIGDYAAATAHLSWDEDMAYSRLLRAYYHSERGIPDGQQYRLARAASVEQRAAVDVVIAEFFTLADGVYQQKRAEEEIARYQGKQEKARASANARWSMRTHSERNANAVPTQCEGNALQTPDTRHQTPIKRKDNAPAGALLPEVDEATMRDWLEVRKAKRAGPVTETVADGLRREAEAAGLSAQEAVRMAVEMGWQGFRADWVKKTAPRPDLGPSWANESPRQRAARLRMEEIAPSVAAKQPGMRAEVIDVFTKQLG